MSLRCKGLSWLFISLTFTFSFKKEYSLSSKEKRRRTWNDVLLSFVNFFVTSTMSVLFASKFGYSFQFLCSVCQYNNYFVFVFRPKILSSIETSTQVQYACEIVSLANSIFLWEKNFFPIRNLLREKTFFFFFTNQQKKRADWNLVRVLRTL